VKEVQSSKVRVENLEPPGIRISIHLDGGGDTKPGAA